MGGMTYSRAHLYCLSGTGNTLRVARWAARKITDLGVPTELASIRVTKNEIEANRDRDRLVAILSPAHGFTAP